MTTEEALRSARPESTLGSGRSQPVIAGVALLLLLLALAGLVLAILGRTPDVVRFGQALLLVGVAEAAVGWTLRSEPGSPPLLLAAAATLLAGLALVAQSDAEVRRLSLMFLGRAPAYTIITVWLLARSVGFAAFAVMRPGSGLAAWAGAVGTAALFVILLAKIPAITLVMILFGSSRDFLPFLTIVAAVALLLEAGLLAGLAQKRPTAMP